MLDQIQLAAALRLRSAVALELSAGTVRAAGLSRTLRLLPRSTVQRQRAKVQLEGIANGFRYKKTDSDATSPAPDRALPATGRAGRGGKAPSTADWTIWPSSESRAGNSTSPDSMYVAAPRRARCSVPNGPGREDQPGRKAWAGGLGPHPTPAAHSAPSGTET